MHVLEAGFEPAGRPLLLLHGFPELAYSWRKVMLPLAAAGYHVVAPDQRGYGRTTGWERRLRRRPRRRSASSTAVRDALGLVAALGYAASAAVIGHDFGSPVAAWCALVRPDVFRSRGADERAVRRAAAAPLRHATRSRPRRTHRPEHPRRPRRAGRAAQALSVVLLDARRPTPTCGMPAGLHAFLRAYYHHKSADWKANRPHRLAGWTASELAKLPTYYIMDLGQDMAETVAPHMPSRRRDRRVHVADRRGARASTAPSSRAPASRAASTGIARAPAGASTPSCEVFSGRTIDVPSMFISGKSDWGVYQRPGAFERMQTKACTRMRGVPSASTAPATGCSRSSPRRWCGCCWSFCSDLE